MPMVPAPGLAKYFERALRHTQGGSEYMYYRIVAKNSAGSVIGDPHLKYHYFGANTVIGNTDTSSPPWNFTETGGRWFNRFPDPEPSFPKQTNEIQDHLTQNSATYQANVRLNNARNTASGTTYNNLNMGNSEYQITMENASGGSMTFHYLEIQVAKGGSAGSVPGTFYPLFTFTVPGNPMVLGIGEKIRLAAMYLRFYAGSAVGSLVRTIINPTYMGTISQANATSFLSNGAWLGLFDSGAIELSSYNPGHSALPYQRQHVRFIQSAGKLFMINPVIFNEVRGSSVSFQYISFLTGKSSGSSVVNTTTGSGLITVTGAPITVAVNNQPWIDVSNAPYLLIV